MTASTPKTAPEVAVHRLTTGLVALGILSLALYSTVLWVLQDQPPLVPGMVLYPLTYLLYFAAIYLVWRHKAVPMPRKRAIALVLGGGIAFRVAIFYSPVPINPDAWRYLWEGKALLEGINTYTAPPSSPVYDGLRAKLQARGDNNWDWLFPRANIVQIDDPSTGGKRWVSLVAVRDTYGLLASTLFAVPTVLRLNPLLGMRLVMELFDLGTCLLLVLMLVSLRRNPLWAIIYCWSPLVMDSFPNRGQVDAPMLFFVVLTVWLLMTNRGAAAGIAFALALGAKISPLLLFIPFARFGGRRFALVFVVAASIVYGPLLAAGSGGIAGITAMANFWRDNDSIYSLLWGFLHSGLGVTDPDRLARMVLILAGIAYALWRGLRRQPASVQALMENVVCISAASLLLSPVVYPWYGTTLVAFLCFVMSPALLLLTAALMQCFLAITLFELDIVPESVKDFCRRYPEPYRWIGYAPVYVLLVVEWVRGILSQRHKDAKNTNNGRSL